eukprot:TRINITY_DN107626_c0_g1_i1.p1 TRINITY_DN107626_c0_g1~~TRINITY_DN107626_c0_g1_i1.p1  ORF type:complete len:257 (-),score=24.97 TRINITY_DN107626_c0_g1_i1:185-955(-)
MGQRWAFIHAFAPILLTLLVLVLATLAPRYWRVTCVEQTSSGMKEETCMRPIHHGVHPKVGSAGAAINLAVARYGSLLGFCVFILQMHVLPFNRCMEDETIPEQCKSKLLPDRCRKWYLAYLVVWILVSVLRIVVFIPIRSFGLNIFFSDHVFLIVCLMAQLQANLFLAHVNMTVRGCRAKTLIGITWLLIGALLYEAFLTVMLYHTLQASWTAFVVACLMFEPVSYWWIQLLSKEDAHLLIKEDAQEYKPLGDLG